MVRPVNVSDNRKIEQPPSKPIEKTKAQKPDIQQIIQKTISEELGKINKNTQENTLSEIKDLLQNIASQGVQAGIINKENTFQEKSVSDEKLAEISQKYIAKLSDGIESNMSKNKKIISDTNIDDLASQL